MRVDSQELAEQAARSCAFSFGSPPAPPSPVPAYRKPSGPNAIVPPWWFSSPGWEMFMTLRWVDSWTSTLLAASNSSILMVWLLFFV